MKICISAIHGDQGGTVKGRLVRCFLVAMLATVSISTRAAGTDKPAITANSDNGICPGIAKAAGDMKTLRETLGRYQVPIIAPLPATVAAPTPVTTLTPSSAVALLKNCENVGFSQAACVSNNRNAYSVIPPNQRVNYNALTGPAGSPVTGDSASASGTINSAAVLSAVDSFLENRAEDEVTPWLAAVLVDRFCVVDQATSFPNTCEALAGVRQSRSTWPSKGALQNAIQSDLKLLPVCSSTGLLQALAKTTVAPSSTSSNAPQKSVWDLSPATTMSNAAVSSTYADAIRRRGTLLLLASFADNLAHGQPLIEDLIGLGKTKYIDDVCSIDQTTGLASASASDLDCPPIYRTILVVSAVLYRGGNVPLSRWSTTPLVPSATAPPGNLYLSDVLQAAFPEQPVSKIPKGNYVQIIGRLTDDANAISGYLKAGDQNQSVNWESAAGAVQDVVSLLSSFDATTNSSQLSESDEVVKAVGVLFTIDMAARSHDYKRVVFLAGSALGCRAISVDETASDHASSETCAFVTVTEDIASASSPDDLVTAMNALSEPSGGWRYKMATNGEWTVGVVVGLSGGGEWMAGARPLSIGAFAPVGISYSRAASDWCFPFASIATDCTFMLNVLDFGGLESYAQNYNQPGFTVDSAPRSSLGAAVSFGFTHYWRLGESPFVAGFSIQHSPNLRTVTLTSGTHASVSSNRYLLFLGVDLVLHSW